LLVSEGSPEIPTGNRPERPPILTQLLNAMRIPIDIPNRAFKTNIAQGKDIWFAKNHYPERRNRPWAYSFDSR
jgi:hypothetical protein